MRSSGAAWPTWTRRRSGESSGVESFNAVCRYGDDHPRNHGLLHRNGRWGLSQAFDIAPYIPFSGTLAMAITREGSALATTVNLLRSCDNFGYEPEEASDCIERCKDLLATGWGDELVACGQPRDAVPAPTFEWLDRA